jgi:hypothetical protein
VAAELHSIVVWNGEKKKCTKNPKQQSFDSHTTAILRPPCEWWNRSISIGTNGNLQWGTRREWIEGITVTPRTPFLHAGSWTHKLASDQKQEHDFSNLISELGYAVRREDMRMMKFCEFELKRMFREKKPAARRRR